MPLAFRSFSRGATTFVDFVLGFANVEIIEMQAVSQMKEGRYREHGAEDIETFFAEEEKSLLAHSNTLIQFIKFLQTDGDNGARLRKLSKAILILQSEF